MDPSQVPPLVPPSAAAESAPLIPAAAMEATTLSLPVGAPAEQLTQIGRYTIVREIGRGGMGVVYEAEDPRLRRRVALKVVAHRLREREQWRERFEREAQLLAAVQHPNIATIFSIEDDADLGAFITTELVSGDTLERVLRNGAIDAARTRSISRQIAAALETAHAAGVIHRDLKPGNVMLTTKDQAKILDFGLAGSLDDAPEAAAGGPLLGTPGYASPEQVEGREAGVSMDLWALGCIMFECLAGTPAFPGETAVRRAVATLQHEPNWDLLTASVPADLVTLVQNLLAREPSRRPRSCSEVNCRLEAGPTGLGVQRSIAQGTTTGRAAGNLPVPLSSFIGRRKETAAVGALLERSRLVTVTGIGGTGKSRLAEKVAAGLVDLPSGAWMVELSALSDPALVPRTTASTLGLLDGLDDPMDALERRFSGGAGLLLVDNCEHLRAACAELASTLLARCPELRVLCTSREPLGVDGESVFHLAPLELPDPEISSVDVLRSVESVQLFVERARLSNSQFSLSPQNTAAVVAICRQLDGIPFAIELAAARVRSLSVDQLAQRLVDRFQPLGRGPGVGPARHRTLRALIDWSYDMLEPGEKRLLRGLSVFAGGNTLEAAESVCGDDVLDSWSVFDLIARLVDKSLVEVIRIDTERGERVRYRLLETIRQYAHDRLLEGEEAKALTTRRARYFLRFAEGQEDRVRSGDPQALALLDEELDNLRLAIRSGDTDQAMRIASALGHYWLIRHDWREGRRICDELLARPDADQYPALRAKLLHSAGTLAMMQGDHGAAGALLEESLRLHRELGDSAGTARALNNLGHLVALLGDVERAHGLHLEAFELHGRNGDEAGEARSLWKLGGVAEARGDAEEAALRYRAARALFERVQNRGAIANMDFHLGDVARTRGDRAEATAAYSRALEQLERLGLEGDVCRVLVRCGQMAFESDAPRAAAGFALRCLATHRELERRASAPPGPLAEAVLLLAELAEVAGETVESGHLIGWVDGLRLRKRLPSRLAEHVEAKRARLEAILGASAMERAAEDGARRTLAELEGYAQALEERLPEALA